MNIIKRKSFIRSVSLCEIIKVILFQPYYQLKARKIIRNTKGNTLDLNDLRLMYLPEYIPDHIIHLNCSNNYIQKIQVLPDTIEYLDCSINVLNNKIEKLPSNLKKLICNDNYHLKKLPTLPIHIKSIICDDNLQLETLESRKRRDNNMYLFGLKL